MDTRPPIAASCPASAPLPAYQRPYSGNRYPRAEQQQTLRPQNCRYQSRDTLVRLHYQEPEKDRAHGDEQAPGRNR